MIHPPSPYVGARALDGKDLIFGRERECAELLDLLVAERIVVLHSPPGAGKTSLINAGKSLDLDQEKALLINTGLAKNLEWAGFRPLPVGRVQSNASPSSESPATNLYMAALVASLGAAPEQVSLSSSHSAGDRLGAALEALATREHGGKARQERLDQEERSSECPLVLIIDQFEELLTTGPAATHPKRQFLDQLAELLKRRRWWLLLAMREDQLPSLDSLLRRSEFHYAARYRLELLGSDEARAAIKGPASSVGVGFKDDAARRLVRDLHPAMTASTPATGEMAVMDPVIDPMQLQLVCHDLWATLPDHTTEIELGHLQGCVDVDSTLLGFYGRGVTKVSRATKTAPRILREWFGRYLITELDTRGTVFRGSDTTGGIPNHVVELLEEENLVRAEPRAGGIWYELSHDRLIKPIRQLNARLAADAKRMVARSRERSLGAAALIMLAAGSVWWTESAGKRSQEQLLSVAESPLAVRGLIVPLLLYKEKRDSATQSELLAAFRRPEPTTLLSLARSANQAVIGANGRLVAAIDSASGSLALWWEGVPVQSPTLDIQAISALAISPSGWRLGLGFHDGRVMILVWSYPLRPEHPRTFNVPDPAHPGGSVTALAFDSKGKNLAVATHHGKDRVSIRWLTGEHWAERNVLSASGLGEIHALAFSPTDSTLLVSVHHNSLVNVWNLTSRERVDSLKGHTGYVYAVAFHPRGHIFATGSKDKTVRVWSTDTWRADTTLRDHSDNVYDVAFSPDGNLMVSAGRDGHVTVWDANKWRHLGDLQHHRGAVRTARFSKDGNTLLTASEDSTLIVWNSRGTICNGCSAAELIDSAEARIEREKSFLGRSGGGYGVHSMETAGISRPSRR